MSEIAAPARRPVPLLGLLAILTLRDVPFWTRSWPRRVLRLGVLIVYGIMLITLILLPFENRLAFPGATFAREWADPHPDLNVRELSLASRDGNTIHAWFSAPPGWKPEQGAILYSHGNGDNLSAWQPTLLHYRSKLDRAVLIYDYPGFGKSTGSPTESGGYAAIDAAHDWLVKEGKVPAGEVILVGSSMGGAFATDLATRAECRMLLLVNSFTSFPDMAQKRFPFLPARWLVSNRMNNHDKIASVAAPVFITHGQKDGVVPFYMGERLYERAHEPKRFYPLADHPHMDPVRAEFFDAVREFLEQTKAK